MGRLLFAAIGMLALSACAASSVEEQRVLAAKLDYFALLDQIAEYEALPRCDSSPAPCSDRFLVDSLLTSMRAINILLDSAEGTVRALRFEPTAPEAVRAANTVERAIALLGTIMIVGGLLGPEELKTIPANPAAPRRSR